MRTTTARSPRRLHRAAGATLAAAALVAASGTTAAWAVTAKTTTDPSGDVVIQDADAAKEAALPASSIDVSQYTVSVDPSSQRVFIKFRAKDLAPKSTKGKKTTAQVFNFAIKESKYGGVFYLSTASPKELGLLASSGDCKGVQGSFDFVANTATASIPRSCLRKDAKVVTIQRAGSILRHGSSFVAYDKLAESKTPTS